MLSNSPKVFTAQTLSKSAYIATELHLISDLETRLNLIKLALKGIE